MRDKRAIIIKDPRLQKIRNNFRDLFYQASRLKRKAIHDKSRNLMFESDGTRRTIDDLSPTELSLFRRLQKQENQITDMINRSILKCVVCGKPHRDVVYNKSYDAWYCTECYGLEHSVALKRSKARRNRGKSSEEKALEEHSKTFL